MLSLQIQDFQIVHVHNMKTTVGISHRKRALMLSVLWSLEKNIHTLDFCFLHYRLLIISRIRFCLNLLQDHLYIFLKYIFLSGLLRCLSGKSPLNLLSVVAYAISIRLVCFKDHILRYDLILSTSYFYDFQGFQKAFQENRFSGNVVENI